MLAAVEDHISGTCFQSRALGNKEGPAPIRFGSALKIPSRERRRTEGVHLHRCIGCRVGDGKC
jgi:hypothetical protein